MQFDQFKPAHEHLSRRSRRQWFKDQMRRREVNAVAMALNLSANTNRGASPAVWSDCPWDEYLKDNSKGMTFRDDFIMTGNMGTSASAVAASLGQWSVYGDAGGVQSDAALEGGVITLGTDGDNENVALQSSTGSFRMVTTSTLALNQKLWYECRIAKSTITGTKIECFAGLCTPSLSSNLPAANIPLTDTDDAMSTTPSFFGFHLVGLAATRGGPTEVEVAFELASGTVNFPTNLTTLMASTGNTVLAASTFVKLGFIFDPNGPFKRITSATARQTAGQVKRALIRFYVNNVEAPTFLTSDDVANATATQAFPTGFMAPCFAVSNQAGTSPGTMSIDWVQVAQKGNS